MLLFSLWRPRRKAALSVATSPSVSPPVYPPGLCIWKLEIVENSDLIEMFIVALVTGETIIWQKVKGQGEYST